MKRVKLFIVSDTHFSHKNIIKYCKRPFKSTKEMNREMIKRWNRVVDKGDLVIHLGDFSLGKPMSIRNTRRKLNGTILLIRGNHDSRVRERYGFILVRQNLKLGKYILSHRPLLRKDVPRGYTNIHGHIHDRDATNGINVCVEKTHYTPMELDKVIGG